MFTGNPEGASAVDIDLAQFSAGADVVQDLRPPVRKKLAVSWLPLDASQFLY